MKLEVVNRHWDPITVSTGAPHLSHLFFADDLILIGKANNKTCITINKLLLGFCAKSRQSINYSKSKVLYSKNCPLDRKNDCFDILKIKGSTSIEKYLSFQIFQKKPTLKDFQYIIDKLKNKLSGWKTRFLNIRGRSILAKTTLNNILNHTI